MNRTLLIGLDGATFSVLDPLMKDGVMPFVADLVGRGVRADLLSTPNPLTPPAWTSLATGRNPGSHGIFDFIRPEETESGVYIKLLSSRDVQCETIWSYVSRNDGRATVLNFPMTYPVRAISGYVVPGFVPLRHLKRSVYPSTLYEKIIKVPGFNAKELAMDLDREKEGVQGLAPEEYAEWIRLHIRRERQWFEVLRYIMRSDPSDLTAMLFDGTDKLQHLAWRFIDPECFPKAPSAWERQVRDLCLSYFRDVDGYIREAVDLAGPEARVFIASDHGFGSTYEIFYLNVWLQQQGYLQWGQAAPQDEAGKILAARMKTQYDLVDWSRTTAYALSPSSNGIYIRVARRPGQPGIRPDAYDAFRAELIDKLLRFTDPVSGEPIVRRVMTREEVFAGAQMEHAPDLTLVLRDYGFISILNADAPLKRRPEAKGMHRPEGVFIAAGSGIKRGLGVPALSIVDVAPMLLYSLGLGIPSDMDGRLPEEIFEDSLLRSIPPLRAEPTRPVGRVAAAATTPALDSEQEEAVLSRLKALGYLE
ncbi:MAG TPA: alkaline phosphatase family protein [Methylomirabilota bacterium]|jgi:predicted AlkP superfamily phosphohydrolase/phosphomutase|nr:alkaline phosphatase family protein [Methylomirabilota bacterium]